MPVLLTCRALYEPNAYRISIPPITYPSSAFNATFVHRQFPFSTQKKEGNFKKDNHQPTLYPPLPLFSTQLSKVFHRESRVDTPAEYQYIRVNLVSTRHVYNCERVGLSTLAKLSFLAPLWFEAARTVLYSPFLFF